MRALFEGEARHRASRISKIAYELDVDLDGELPDYRVQETIRFDLKGANEPVTIDFRGGTLENVAINGAMATEQVPYNGFFLTLPAARLRAGSNEVRIVFRHAYGKAGVGLYRAKDPQDGRVYLYTDFEPYDANEFFPCFDQPDLKATYRLSVGAPADWTVISSTRETSVEPDGVRKRWRFPETAKFSSYVFSLHAGPYKMWSAHAGRIPLRLFARQSMAKYVDPDLWFRVTRQGFSFYERFFGTSYPFKKYDQVMVPDFNSGAMENVGAVTFSERYAPRSKPTYQQRQSLASVILHEMAHMWFGDLVTMRWWNGTWLNESFATFMAARALTTTEFGKDAWLQFFLREKRWAYVEDQLVTTHPIEAIARDTDTAFVNFDGITYGKGASVLKQLSFYLGEDKFRKGLRAYFKQHAYSNTELGDFIGAMEKASGRDLSGWVSTWLKTAGLNTLSPVYACKDGRIASFSLAQGTAVPDSELRPHRTQVALYSRSGSGLRRTQVVPVAYEGARTEVAALRGKPCPALVDVNHGDYDYVKARPDARSLDTLKTDLEPKRLHDPLTRAMQWLSFYELMRDAELPLTSYYDLVLKQLPLETNEQVTSSEAWDAVRAEWYLPLYEEPQNAVAARYAASLEQMAWAMLTGDKVSAGSDLQKIWYDVYVDSAVTSEGLDRLDQLLAGKLKLEGFVFDQDRRWNTIIRLARQGRASADLWLETERRADRTDAAERNALAVQAARPILESKRKWFELLARNDEQYTLAKKRAIATNLFPVSQRKLLKPFASEYFTTLLALNAKQDTDYLNLFTSQLAPIFCADENTRALADFLDANENLNAGVVKALRRLAQENDRCVRVRARALSDASGADAHASASASAK